MKKLMGIFVLALFTTFVMAATPEYSPSLDQLAWAASSDTDTTEQAGKSLDEIVEEEGWKLKKPFTGSDWDWNWNWDEKGERGGKGGKTGYFRGGAGGWDVFMLPLKIENLNQQLLTNIGVGDLDEQMFLTGGGGWGFVGRGIRIGGMGAGGYVKSVARPYEIQKQVTLSVGFGGFTIDKVFHPFNRSELSLGLMIGGGSASLDLVQWSGAIDWQDILNGYGIDTLATKHDFHDYQTKLSTEFFTLMPSIGFRYNIFRWFAVGGGVGYFYAHMNSTDWEMEKKPVTGMPKLDFSNVIYRVNFYFGG